jgi:hypothetical protein
VYGLTTTEENFTLHTYHDLAKETIYKKARFHYKYIFRKYPYRLYNHNSLKSVNSSYFDLLPKGIKIAKKYIFLKNLRRNHCFKYHKNFYEAYKVNSVVIFKKMKNWNSPFLNKYYGPYDLIKFSHNYYKPHVLISKLRKGGALLKKYSKLFVRKERRYKYARQLDSVRY